MDDGRSGKKWVKEERAEWRRNTWKVETKGGPFSFLE